jgi:hypothetical protein
LSYPEILGMRGSSKLMQETPHFSFTTHGSLGDLERRLARVLLLSAFGDLVERGRIGRLGDSGEVLGFHDGAPGGFIEQGETYIGVSPPVVAQM